MTTRKKKRPLSAAQVWLDIGYDPKRRKELKERFVSMPKACPECGERRKRKIVHLRPGFKYCETCKTEYLVSELVNQEDVLEEEQNEQQDDV